MPGKENRLRGFRIVRHGTAPLSLFRPSSVAQNAVTGLLGPFLRLFFSRLSPVVLPDLADPILISPGFHHKRGLLPVPIAGFVPFHRVHRVHYLSLTLLLVLLLVLRDLAVCGSIGAIHLAVCGSIGAIHLAVCGSEIPLIHG